MVGPFKNLRLPNPRIAIWLAAGLLFVLGILQVAQGFIDTKNYRDGILQVIKEHTGRDVAIKGKVTVQLLPVPTIYVPGVELRDAESETPAPAISVAMMRLRAPIGSIFSDHPRINGIALDQPVLELTRAHDNQIHWDWLNAALLKTFMGGDAGTLTLEINDGRILYQDKRSDTTTSINDINGYAVSGTQPGLRGSFELYGHALKLVLNTEADSTSPASGATPLHVKLSGDGNVAQLDGGIDLSGETPVINGKLALELQDARNWVQKLQPDQSGDPAIPEQPPTMPAKLTAAWAQRGLALDLSDIKIDGLGSTGGGTFSLGWDEWRPSITADMSFTMLDYTAWRALADAAFLEDIARLNVAHGDQPVNPLSPDLRFSIKVAADQFKIGQQSWKDMKLDASMENAAITVNQFHITMPGESTLSLFGVVSEGSTGGLRFEGSMETQGKSLRQMLTVFDASASDLPETGFGDFYARSNLFISAEQMRLSEADAKLSDLRLNGGLVFYYDDAPRMEADVKLKDINFDYFRDAWREQHKDSTAKNDFFLRFDRTLNFNWLRSLHNNIDLKVNVEGFTFLEQKGDAASFRLFAKEGQFGIYNARFHYPEETLEASLNLDVRGEQPLVNLLLSADTLDTGYFLAAPAAEVTPAKHTGWSEELMDMGWMQGWNGSFDVSIGALHHKGMDINNLKLQAKLDNNVVSFQSLGFDYWQGRFTVNGSIYGGQVPGVSLSFTLYNAELHDMLKELTGRDNITGRASVSGAVAASGVNALSWVSQADAKLVLAGRGVMVNGINLEGALSAVSVSRTAADVVNNVNQALVNGSTQFDVDGNINVKDGIMKTPGITLKAGTILGNMTGEVKLVPWTMDVSTQFQFPALTSETVPTLIVQLSGSPATTDLRADTSSLEAYVAKRIISR